MVYLGKLNLVAQWAEAYGRTLMRTVQGVVITALAIGCLMLPAGCWYRETQQPGQPEAEELVILCPSIFGNVIKETVPDFQKAYANVRIKTLVYPIRPMLEDILAGKATGDVFLALGDVELSHLYDKGLADRGTEKPIAQTSLVALAMPGNPLDLKALRDIAKPTVKKISIPDPQFNSGGKAFLEAARSIGIYENIKDRLLLAPGPRKGTESMTQGKAEVAVTHNKCYAGHAKKNALIESIPTDLHQPIVCKAVILRSSGNPDLAATFIEFLRTDESQARFKKALFATIE